MNRKSLKLNFLMNALLTMSSFVFPLITFPYVSRVLLPVGTGKVSFSTSLISYFLMFSQLGVPTYGIRACAKARDNKDQLTKTAQELLIINLIMSIVSYIFLAIALITIPRLHEDRNLYVIISITIFLSAIGMEWLYKALEEYTYITVRSIVFKCIALIFMFLLIHKPEHYVRYGAITIFASSASNVLNFVNAHKYISLKPVGNYDFKKHMEPILTFFALSCATTVYTHLDTVMLGFMTNDTEVGYYNAAIKIKQILVSIVTSLGTVLLPRSSYYVEHGLLDEFYRVTKKALEFVFLIAVPLLMYFIIYAKEGILFLAGKAFLPSVMPMQIIMPTLLLIGVTNILGIQMLVPLGKEKIVLYSVMVGAIVDLVLNMLFIPVWKSSGAAFGTLIAELSVLIFQYCYVKKDLYEVFSHVQYIIIIIGVLMGTIFSYISKTIFSSNFMILMVSAVLFFGFYYSVLLLLKEPFTIELTKQIKDEISKRIKS